MKALKERLEYYSNNFYIWRFISLLVHCLLGSFFTILFSFTLQSLFTSFITMNAIRILFSLVATLVCFDAIYMFFKSEVETGMVIFFYEKILIGIVAIFIISPETKDSFLQGIADNKLLDTLGFSPEIITVWIPITFILLNFLHYHRSLHGSRMPTKAENELEIKLKKKELAYIEKLKKDNKEVRRSLSE